MRKLSLASQIRQQIRIRMAFMGIRSLLQLAEVTGISYHRIRLGLEYPEKFTMAELDALARTIGIEITIGG